MSPKMIFCCPFFRISNQAVYLHEIWHVGTSTNIRKKQKMAVSFLQTPSTLNMHDVPSPHRTQNTEHIQNRKSLRALFPHAASTSMASVGGWSSHSSYSMAAATPLHTYHPPSSPPTHQHRMPHLQFHHICRCHKLMLMPKRPQPGIGNATVLSLQIPPSS